MLHPRASRVFHLVGLWVVALWFGATTLSAQVPLAPTKPIKVTTSPTAEDRGANTGPFTATFTVTNESTGSVSDISLACSSTGTVTCGTVTPNFRSVLAAGASFNVSVGFSVGAPSTATLRLTATYGDVTPETSFGERTITVLVPPTVTLVVPSLTAGARAVVRTRQPLIRALFLPGGGAFDTTKTSLKWRGVAVTSLSRHNRGLLEWEVDSTRWLAIGDSAVVEVKACDQLNGCTTVTRWAVLENDQKPVLGFTGMPLGAYGGGFGAPFGPGLSVSGPEVETGFSIPSYTSMGVGRSAGLVYSTRQSFPRALVNVDLELPWPAGTPSQVKLVLLDGIVRLDSLVLSNPTCATGALKRCRGALQADFAASTFATPTRKWLTVEASVTSGGTTKMGSDSVEVVLVDRRSTSYGSGWWPAGVSQVVAAGPDRVLVGPTGIATIYRGNGDSVYIPPPGSFVHLFKAATGWELRARGDSARVRFDSQGRVRASVDRNGNRDSVVYSGTTERVTSLRDPIGESITFAYNANNKLTTFTDPGGRQSKVTINATTNQLTYDSLSSPTATSNRTTFVYQTYPGTKTVVLKKRIGVILDTTIVIYDSTFKRRPVQARLAQVKDETGAPVNPTISYTAYERQGYGALRSLDSVYVELKDPRNNWTRSLLNRWGQSRKSWDALGLLSRSEYTPDGLLSWSEGKNGDSSRVYHDYDGQMRLARTWITRGGNVLRIDSLVYDANHRVVKRIDSRGKVDSLTYDARGNVIATRDPAGAVSRIWYAANGLIDSTRAPLATKSREYQYDAVWSNLFRIFDETGQVALKNVYDGFGHVTTADQRIQVRRSATATDWQWRRVHTFYNAGDQADSTVLLRTGNCPDPCSAPPTSGSLAYDPADTLKSERVGYRFDRAGRDSVRVNARGIKTLYLYDRLGRLLSRRPWTDSMAVKDSMLYDLAGNLKKTITRRGDQITTNYDSRNRDTLTVIPGVGTLRKRYTGPQDQLTAMWYDSPVDSIGGVDATARWGYDTRGRLRADTAYSNGVKARTYTYDTYERLSGYTDVTGTWSVRYDSSRGYPDTLITAFSDTISHVLDLKGRPTSLRVGLGTGTTPLMRTYQWDVTGKLNVLNNQMAGFTAGKYDRVGADEPDGPALRPAWTLQHGAGAAIDSLQDSVRYDGWERVAYWKLMRNKITFASDSLAFTRTSNVRAAPWDQEYHTVTDRLLQHSVSGTSRTYTYDRAGNLTQMVEGANTWILGYDALDQLRSVRRNGVLIARYAYDVLGRRIAKRVYSAATGGTVGYTRFVYQGDHVAVESDSAGVYGLRYTWAPGTDQLAAVRDAAGAEYAAVLDKLGSVRGLVRRDGTWFMSQTFGPYGALIRRDTTTAGASVPLRYGWTGREFDAETGWYFHRSRYYDPQQRRFVQEDPIGYGGGSNLYEYVGGQVLEATDPSGMIMLPADPGLGGGGLAALRGGYLRGAALEAWGEGLYQAWDAARQGQGGLYATYSNGDEKSCAEVPAACRAWLSANGGARQLTEDEIHALGNMCASIACQNVTLYTNVKNTGGGALTLGHDIYIEDPANIPLLAHEMSHVGQFEQWGAGTYYLRAVWTQFKHHVIGSNQYAWQHISPDRPFGRYGIEQQATIVQDCFVQGAASARACTISPYRP